MQILTIFKPSLHALILYYVSDMFPVNFNPYASLLSVFLLPLSSSNSTLLFTPLPFSTSRLSPLSSLPFPFSPSLPLHSLLTQVH